MRMVIDSNVLKDDVLREYLVKSRKNIALVTDYIMIEALKGDTLNKIFGLMKILSEFPKQIIVLKSMRSVSQLKGRRSGMTRRMIEPDQTKGFENWCAGLTKAAAGDKNYQQQLVESGKEAAEQLDRILADQSSYGAIIVNEAKNYTQDELRILRTDEPYTPAMVDKMTERIVSLTITFFEQHPHDLRPPTVLELPYTFIFRLAVCAYLQALSRIRDGAQNIKADKIANDVVDATFAAYATYFQGLLSNDAKADALYRNAKYALKGFPVSPDKLVGGARQLGLT